MGPVGGQIQRQRQAAPAGLKARAMTFDDRSEKNIATLLPRAQEVARALLGAQNAALAPLGMEARITSGLRTYAEQDTLYEQPRDGKDNDGDGMVDEADEKVTNARAGESWHNFGVAWDITIFRTRTTSAGRKGAVVWESHPYEVAAACALGMPVDRGIDWPGAKKDRPHYQLALGITLATARALHDAGKPVA